MSEAKTATEAQLREWIAAGETVAAIAARLDVPRSYVYITLQVLGLKAKRAKKTPALAHQYLQSLALGYSLDEIAKERDVSRQAVYAALRNAGMPTCSRAYLRQQAASQPLHSGV